MIIEAVSVDDVLVLAPNGRLDSTSAGPADEKMNAHVVGGANRIVLDLSSVAYVSSAGLRIVLLMAKRLKQQGGRFVVCGLSESVREVFTVSGFLQILTVTSTRDDAVVRARG